MLAPRGATGTFSITIAAQILLAISALAPMASANANRPAAQAKPGAKAIGRERARSLGLPQEPRILFREDFEHEMTRHPVLLTKYQGPPPLAQTYAAAPRFLENCNGYIVQFESNERQKATDCEEVAFNRVRQMAWVLGKLEGATPTANHAVSAYTDGKQVLPADSIQFETVKPIPIQANGRFITFSVDATETNCHRNHAELKFYLLEGAVEIPTFSSPIDPCTAKNSQVIEPPTLGTKAEPFLAGSFAGNAATLFSGTQLGIRMRNGQTSETGNDASFDNIQILDATPQLEKSFSPAINNVGATAQLTYTITNTSELGAKSGWGFTDALPTGLVIASPAKGSTTCAEPTTIEAVAGGGSVTVSGNLAAEAISCTVTVDVTSDREGSYVNGPGNVIEKGLEPPADATVEFADNADLAIEKSAAPIPGRPGTNSTFTLKVTNNGPDTAKDVVVADPLPAGLDFVSASAPCSLAGGSEVKCALGSLPAGGSVTLTVVVRIPESAGDGFVNTATVTGSTPDPNLSNNSDTASVPLLPEADLAIRKIALPKKLTAGGEVAYVLLVHNFGPSDATNVTVTDPLPASLTPIDAHPSQGTCSTELGLVCHLGSVAHDAGAQIFLLARVAANASGSIANTSTVTAGQVDPNPDNNSSTAAIAVTPLTPEPLAPPSLAPETAPRKEAPPQPISDLKVVKHVNHAAARIGQRLTYTLDVSNLGPDAAADVRVTDSWSLGLRLISVRPSQGSCGRGLPLVCSLGRIGSGHSARIRMVAVVEQSGRERNTARATSASRDPNLANNESAVETAVAPKRRPPPVVTG